MDRPPLYELTKSFCVAFYDNNQTALNQLLSADCRMQNRYGRTARGVNGIASCINKLITLRSSIATHFPHGQGGSEMFVETFTSNFSQSCCILTIQTGDRLRKLSVCFGLEWDCNIVIGIVFRYNVDPRFYIRDLYSQDPVDDADRAPTSWDMSVSIVGAVLSSSDLEDCSGHGEEQSIFLHRKPGVTTQAEVDEESCSTLSEASAHTATVAEARPISRCLRPAFATLERAKACVERRVGFSLELAVVLVPELKCKPNDGIFYTHIDFRRFSVDAEDDINELIKVSKVSFMDKDSAKLVLYQDPAVPLMTQFNTELSIGDVACELSEDDGPPGISCEESPGPRRVASMSREPSITRALSFDDDIDRESFSKHHGVSVDGAGGSKGTDDVSWFDRLYDIITGALDADEPVRHHVEPDKRILLNYYLNTSSDAKVQSSLLPLG